MGKRKADISIGSVWQALDADQVLRLAAGLRRAKHDAMLGRRDLIRYLVARAWAAPPLPCVRKSTAG